MVEFAIVIPIFLLLVFGIMEFARLFFVQDNVERAVAATARYASIGTHESGTDPSTGKPYTRVKSITDYLQQQASEAKALGASLSNIQISSTYGGAGTAGGPQDIATISLTVTVPLWTPLISRGFPNGQYTFTSSASTKNEPFPPNQAN